MIEPEEEIAYEIDEGELGRRPASPDEPSAPSPRLLSAISAQPGV